MAASLLGNVGNGFFAREMDAGTQDPKVFSNSTEEKVIREVISPIKNLISSCEKMNGIKPSDELEKGIGILSMVQENVKNLMSASQKKEIEEINNEIESSSHNKPTL